MPRAQQTFDYYVRSLTTSLLALGIMGAAIYTLITGNGQSTALLGWAGLVVGVYFGGHIAFKGVTAGATNGTTNGGNPAPKVGLE